MKVLKDGYIYVGGITSVKSNLLAIFSLLHSFCSPRVASKRCHKIIMNCAIIPLYNSESSQMFDIFFFLFYVQFG